MQAVTLNTNGKGYWSRTAKAVEIVDMRVTYVNEEKDFGELRVYFDTTTWNVKDLGLIYTDSKFLSMLQAFLCEHGINGNDVDYSEQGMQGNNYVSLDVGKKFLASWAAKFDVKLADFV